MRSEYPILWRSRVNCPSIHPRSDRAGNFVHNFNARELFDFPTPYLAEHVIEQWTVAKPDLMELNTHAETVDHVFHLCFQRKGHVEDVQHQPEIGTGTQRLHGSQTCAVFGDLLHLASNAQRPVRHLRLSFNIEPRTTTAVDIVAAE